MLTCLAPAPNFIVTGAATVLINGLPAARITDKTMHPPPGVIIGGSSDVLIGGPTVGVTLGNPVDAKKTFRDMAKGRQSKDIAQSYNNCGVESSRQLIRQATGSKISEDKLLDSVLNASLARREATREASGGTSPEDRRAILAANGVASSLVPNTMENITQAIAEKRGVITSHEIAELWGVGQGGHAITVTGAKYDENGNMTHVVINDTGQGKGGREVPSDQYARSLRPGRDANVTDEPIW